VGKTLNVKDFDLERIFGKEGVQVVHLSGLIAALSPDTSNFCLEIARYAKKHDTLISFDLNSPRDFLEGSGKELKEAFTEIVSLSDIVIGNEEDFQLCLGIEGPKAGGENIGGTLDAFKGMILNAHKAFPHVSVLPIRCVR
jgi:2-dehydro-3-deoxygluconokinase